MLPNPERERKIREQWKLGSTITETSLFLGIPRSTVGYYYKKLGKRHNIHDLDKSEVHKVGEDNQKNDQMPFFIFTKTLGWREVISAIKTSSYQDAYYRLATMKLLLELWKYLRFSKEELQSLTEALKTSQKPATKTSMNGSQADIPKKKGKGMKEILEEFHRENERRKNKNVE